LNYTHRAPKNMTKEPRIVNPSANLTATRGARAVYSERETALQSGFLRRRR